MDVKEITEVDLTPEEGAREKRGCPMISKAMD